VISVAEWKGTVLASSSQAVERRRHTPDVRRAMIVAAAQEAIVEDGFPATSARSIAARCGIAVGTLTYHFDSIDALLVEALKDASERMTDDIATAVARESGAVARLRRLVKDALPDTEGARRAWRLWLEYWARAAHSPALAHMHSERYQVWRNLVLSILEDGVEAGELMVPDPALTTSRLVALIDGLGLQTAIGDRNMTIAEARSILFTTIDGLVTPSSPAR
jgi:AcrR family transcriptional regulator